MTRDLFDQPPQPPRYPEGPGFKEHETSKAAAHAVAGKVEGGRKAVLDAICEAGEDGITADQVAEKIGRTILFVRPRVSELRKLRKVRKHPTRRGKNASGQTAHVWVAI